MESSSGAGPGVRLFVSIEPGPAFGAAVQALKEDVLGRVGPQQYLHDPPHLTLYVASFAGPETALAEWPGIAALALPTEVRVVGWHVFEQDPLNGRNTLVCQLADEDQARLRMLQSQVVARLAPRRLAAESAGAYAARHAALSAEQQRNLREAGFPFLGAGWHPHVTIAAIAPAVWQTVWPALENRAPIGTHAWAGLRLYQIHPEGVRPLTTDV